MLRARPGRGPLRHLEYFVAVAEELHFGRAAERLHMAQPPLSQQIRRLEEELGAQLFYRTKRRVQLTEVGQAFLQEARLTLAQAEQAVRVAQRAGRGELGQLIVGFVGSAGYGTLPHLLKIFRERFPDVNLVLRELTSAQQVQALRNARIQVGFLRSPVRGNDLVFEDIQREPLLVALPEQHPLASRLRIPLQALAGESFIIFPRHLGPAFYDQIITLCQQAGFSPNVVQEAIEMQTIVSLVAAEIGVALVPASIRHWQRVGVMYRELEGETTMTTITMAWRKDDTAPVLHTFLNAVREVMAGERRT